MFVIVFVFVFRFIFMIMLVMMVVIMMIVSFALCFPMHMVMFGIVVTFTSVMAMSIVAVIMRMFVVMTNLLRCHSKTFQQALQPLLCNHFCTVVSVTLEQIFKKVSYCITDFNASSVEKVLHHLKRELFHKYLRIALKWPHLRQNLLCRKTLYWRVRHVDALNVS
uniref:Uncharacterized protein n=1 Tax=Ixodes ricinus TaxID=34613 RepID=A0A6B0UX63_IXORI